MMVTGSLMSEPSCRLMLRGSLLSQNVLAPIAIADLPNLLGPDCQCSLVQPVTLHPMLDPMAAVLHLLDHLRELILPISLSLTEWFDSSHSHVSASMF